MLLQAAFLAGNVQWAETREARRVLLLLGFPKAESLLDLIVVRTQGHVLTCCCQRLLFASSHMMVAMTMHSVCKVSCC